MKNGESFGILQSDRVNRLKKGVFIVPSLLTTANIFCGFYSVIESLKGSQLLALGKLDASTAHFDIAAQCIGWAVLFDFLDGRIARMANATTEFGVELDSLADILSFGIAPAVLAYSWGFGNIDQFQKLGWAVSFMFLVCGALRLARFNVQSHKPVAESGAKKKYFVGMPIPAGASLIASIIHFTPAPLSTRTAEINFVTVNINPTIYSTMLLFLVAVLALLMISTIRYNSFKSNRSHSGSIRKTIVMIAVGIFAIYSWSQITLLLMATFYVSMGPVGKLFGFLHPNSSIPPETAEMELNQ